jgi:type III pantothenate kinase
MAVLLVDVGNTAWKYVVLDKAADPIEVVNRADASSIEARLRCLQEAVSTELEWVAVSSVGQPQALTTLRDAFSSPTCEFKEAVVEQDYQGFHLGYADVSRLGVDRWLAMLAVRKGLAQDGQALIADCGTAVTLEWLSVDEHLGGLIAPGLRLMAQALSGETADLPNLELSALKNAAVWAHGTENAIAAGCRQMVVGLLQQQRLRAGDEAALWLTGGDAPSLLNDLPGWQYQQHLVLEGLRLWACQGH